MFCKGAEGGRQTLTLEFECHSRGSGNPAALNLIGLRSTSKPLDCPVKPDNDDHKPLDCPVKPWDVIRSGQ